MNNPKLSIIVPIYNARETLKTCIESILEQNYNFFELVLVNDGSNDNSGEICREYELKDARVKSLSKANGGVSSARNMGLQYATGDWVMFVDSDDHLCAHSLGELLNYTEVADLVVGASIYGTPPQVNVLGVPGLYNGEQLKALIEDNVSHPLLSAPWAKLFRRDIIESHHIKFDESLCFGEDAVFVKEYMLYINTVRILPTPVYCYYDIGDEIYKKYNKSFDTIINYYRRIIDVYGRLGVRYDTNFPTNEIVGVVYNFVIESLRQAGLKDWCTIRQFLVDNDVQRVMRKRQSIHINNLLWLSKNMHSYVFLGYFRITEFLKGYIN